MKSRRAFALLAAAAVVAGCGGSSPNGVAAKAPKQIIDAAKSAALGAQTVHIDGTIGAPGQAVAVDIHIKKSAGATGTIGIGGTNVQVVRIGSTLYLRAPAAFFEKVPSAANTARTGLLANKWVKTTTANSDFSDVATLTDITALFGGAIQVAGEVRKQGTATVRTQPAIKVGDANATLFVATTGTPYPLELTSTAQGSTAAGKVYFDDWNAPVTIVAPPHAIDVEQAPNAAASTTPTPGGSQASAGGPTPTPASTASPSVG